MRVKKLFLLFLVFILNVGAVEYIQDWKKVSNKSIKDPNLSKKLYDNYCTPLEKQKKINEMYNKNKKSPHLQNCFVEDKYSDDDLGIVSWESIIIKKGFILSLALAERGCKNIFKKQIYHFYHENKKDPRNLDLFSPGDRYVIQSCKKEDVVKIVQSEPARQEASFFDGSFLYFGYERNSNNDFFALGFNHDLNYFSLRNTINKERILVDFYFHHYKWLQKYKWSPSLNISKDIISSKKGENDSFVSPGFAYNDEKNKINISYNIELNHFSVIFNRKMNDFYGISFFTREGVLAREFGFYIDIY